MYFKLKTTKSIFVTLSWHYNKKSVDYFDFISTIALFILAGHLNKRAQVVFQPFLVTSGDYMYDHTAGAEQSSVILEAFF